MIALPVSCRRHFLQKQAVSAQAGAIRLWVESKFYRIRLVDRHTAVFDMIAEVIEDDAETAIGDYG